MEREIISSTLMEQTRAVLRDDIISLRLRPGEKLTVDSLSERFGISRTPVRDALNALVEEGLVTVAPRVGYYVVDLSTEDIKEISGIRRMIELYAFGIAAGNMDRDDVQSLLCDTLASKNLPAKERRATFERLDRQFHMDIIRAAGNRRLVDLFMPIASFVDLMRNLNVRVEEALEEHIAILQTVLDGDTDQAMHLLEEHLNSVESAILLNVRDDDQTLHDDLRVGLA